MKMRIRIEQSLWECSIPDLCGRHTNLEYQACNMVQGMRKIDDIVQNCKRIGISGHVNPDGDCIGSSLAVYNYIRTYYPDTEVCLYLEPIPNVFRFLSGSSDICSECKESVEYDLFLTLDCGDLARLGNAGQYFEQAKHTVCIDHHISNQAFAVENHIVPDASSTSELVFQLMDPDRITLQIAECLYTGIIHDTGMFLYSSTSPATMRAAAVLMEKGIAFTKIADETFYAKTYEQNQVLGRALLDSKRYLDGKCIVSVITAEHMKEYQVLPKHMEGIVSALRNTKDVEAALFLYEASPGTFKASLRSKYELDVSKIAVKFGGGGHIRAAGFTMTASPETITELVMQQLKEQMSDR